MSLFARFRRHEDHSPDAAAGTRTVLEVPLPPAVVPRVNARVSVATGEHVPVPTRVEDVAEGVLVLAEPALALEAGDRIVLTWETDGAWYSLDTRVTAVDSWATVPTVQVAAAGRLSRFDERRTDIRRQVQRPLELQVLRARAVRPGRTLGTRTIEVSGNAIRFVTSAPFAPGDLVEARLDIDDGAAEHVRFRARIIRMDVSAGSWRQTCTAVFDEMLRVDRARVVAYAAAGPPPEPAVQPGEAQADPVPTHPFPPPSVN